MPDSAPRKVVLKCHLAPGDLLMLSAAIRDLHRAHPGRYLTDVRTLFPDLWKHSPDLTPLDDRVIEVGLVDCDQPLAGGSTATPGHYLSAFANYLSAALLVPIPLTEFRGAVYLSEAEQNAPSLISHYTGKHAPYWLISTGGKHDFTTKWWPPHRFQTVVDHFRGRLCFVQVGAAGDAHPGLRGVIDLRGRTDLRQLIQLVHHADGVLCGVTFLMHLAAAVPRPATRNHLRPCVVVGGAREPAHWEAYPGHQFLSTAGTLPCCAREACWKARVRLLGDGSPVDQPSLLCADVRGGYAQCMNLIAARDVIRRIELYLEAGSARCLTAHQTHTARAAARSIGPSGFDDLPLHLSSARPALEAVVQSLQRYPKPKARGRGIVICGGGAQYFTNAWVCIHQLRRVGCSLPIELWHLGPHEMDRPMQRLAQSLGVRCVDASRLQRFHPTRRLGGWGLKPFALVHTSFREVLLLDADNTALRNPEFLFDSLPFQRYGAVFWPDFQKTPADHPIWRSCDLPVPDEPECESGQILVDRGRCWRALRLTLWFNEHSDFYYQYLYGDKDTFRLAFRRLNQTYTFVPHPLQHTPGVMYQHDFQGHRLFQHRNTLKWTLLPHNPHLPGFKFETECLADLEALRRRWDGRRRWLQRQLSRIPEHRSRAAHLPSVGAWMLSCPARETDRHSTLLDLSRTDWSDLPVNVLVDSGTHPDPCERVNLLVQSALHQFLDTRYDLLLLLEDDLSFNRHLHHNLEVWPPLRRRSLAFAGLYHPPFREIAYDLPDCTVAAAPESVYGCKATLLSRRAASRIAQNWSTQPGPHDLRLVRLATQLGHPLLFHAPSLVQHRPVPSLRHARYHQAPDFDADWRHP